jgi:hypothetical protein
MQKSAALAGAGETEGTGKNSTINLAALSPVAYPT